MTPNRKRSLTFMNRPHDWKWLYTISTLRHIHTRPLQPGTKCDFSNFLPPTSVLGAVHSPQGGAAPSRFNCKNKTLGATCCHACHPAHYLWRCRSFDGFELVPPLNGSSCWVARGASWICTQSVNRTNNYNFLCCLHNSQHGDGKRKVGGNQGGEKISRCQKLGKNDRWFLVLEGITAWDAWP